MLDLDDDGRLDVFATLFADSREDCVWAFLQPAHPAVEPWRAVQIDPGPLFGVHSQSAGRFDGTARPQVMVGETNIGGFGFGPNPAAEIYIYRRVGIASEPSGWERILVDTRGTHEATAADFDGDGYDDIAGDEENTELIVRRDAGDAPTAQLSQGIGRRELHGHWTAAGLTAGPFRQFRFFPCRAAREGSRQVQCPTNRRGRSGSNAWAARRRCRRMPSSVPSAGRAPRRPRRRLPDRELSRTSARPPASAAS